MQRIGLVLAACATLAGSALADTKAPRVQPTMSGKVVSIDTSTGTLVLSRKDGSLKRFHLVPTAHFKNGERNCTASAFAPGRQVAVRLCGPINDNPVQIDLVCDILSSSQYVATAAPAPYNTPMGDFPTTNGVGGSTPPIPGIQRPDHTIGILGNGGKADGPQLGPINQGGRLPAESQLMNGIDSNLNNNAAINMMGVNDEGGPQSGQSAVGGTGMPVTIRAQIVRADPGSRTIQVQAVGTSVPQNVVLGAQTNVPLLAPGSFVTIMGQTNPTGGYIEATQVIPMGSAPGR